MSEWLHRILSLSVVAVYAVLVGSGEGGRLNDVPRALLFSILPLALIWFPEPLGRWTGRVQGWGPVVNQESPGCLVRLLGWVLLLLPAIIGALVWMTPST